MKSAAEHTSRAMFHMKSQPETPEPSTVKPFAWTDRLHSRFLEMYGTKWIDYVELIGGPAAAARAWGQALADLTAQEVRTGLDTLLKSGGVWPPSIPEFRAVCRPLRMAEVEFERAAMILGTNPIDWSGDAVLYAAVKAVGAFDVRLKPYSAVRDRWTRALVHAQIDAMNGTLPPAPETPAGLLVEKPTERSKAIGILSGLKERLWGANHG